MIELLKHLEKERDFLITTLGSTYEKDELLNASGRLYEIAKVINTIKEMEGLSEN
ncbi:hypothetical protein [Priestia megaterium]|uniref:hypothetical protein n=1 Tax=Priestia megaterium TaxID=1404 RepID=UPI0023DB9977|nr:hypothetical protein [Priestia megaterium]MDF2010241.1 hypothetical protein [Priestia megaterium]